LVRLNYHPPTAVNKATIVRTRLPATTHMLELTYLATLTGYMTPRC